MARLGAFCRITLAPLGRTGRRHCRQAASVFSGRIAQWQAGQFHSLASAYLSQSLQSPKPLLPDDDSELPEPVRRAALRAIRDGALSKASRILSESSFPLPVDCPSALRALHPTAPSPTFSLDGVPQGDDFTIEEILLALRTFTPGSAGGYSGLMASHLVGDEGPEHMQLLQSLANLCSAFAWGRLPPEANAMLASARLIPLGKKDGGIRPIAVGETVRRLAGKLLVSRYQSTLSLQFHPSQLGVGFKGGSEVIIHRIRDWLSRAGTDEALLQIDFRNAFNSLSREQMLPAILSRCPLLYRYAVACYGQPASLFADGFQLESSDGEHQGDPLAPAFFAATIQPLVDLCNSPDRQWGLWYLDDGHLMGPRSTLSTFLPTLEEKAKTLGIILYRCKCSVLFLDPPPADVDFFPGVPILPANKAMRVLGSPIGSPQACQDWVLENSLGPLQRALSRLECLGDPHSASLVLRKCLSGIKINFLLRTTDPITSAWTAAQVSPMLRVTWGVLLGASVSDAQWELACLPIRLGGAGIQDPLHFCDAAFFSPWLSAFSAPSILSPHQTPGGFLNSVTNLCLHSPQLAAPLISLSTLGD